MDLELDPELTPSEIRWNIDGTGAIGEVDPKLRSKGYNPNMDLELDPDQELTSNWDKVGHSLDHSQSKSGALIQVKSDNANMDVDLELTPTMR